MAKNSSQRKNTGLLNAKNNLVEAAGIEPASLRVLTMIPVTLTLR